MIFSARLLAILAVVLALFSAGNTAGRASTSSHVTVPFSGDAISKGIVRYADAYWARVAGADTNKPPHANGHDEFAAAWTKAAMKALHGLGAVAITQPFRTPGFQIDPATGPGVNVIILVPGSQHPGETVLVGTHYDGEATSKGSAYDDTSGSMILLALARAMGPIWRSQGRPSRTVELVLFDAEEQGLVGSVAYTFDQEHHAITPRTAMMIDEEQSGVGYPVRPFGLLSNGPLPTYAVTNGYNPPDRLGISKLTDPTAEKLLISRLQDAATDAFPQLEAHYSPMQYTGGSAPVFTSSDQGKLIIGPSPLCCSDNAPFQVLGIPTVTFAGEADFYSSAPKPWSYPYDQPQDTPQALACDTGGSPTPGPALAAALDLPLALSIELLQSYASPAQGTAITIFSSVPKAGKAVQLTAAGATSVRWRFGDGSSGHGNVVSHVYKQAGTYTVRASSGSISRTARLVVPKRSSMLVWPFGVLNPPAVRHWAPGELKNVPGCGGL